MDEQQETSNLQPDKWRNRLGLIMRWLGGGIAGLVTGFLLFFLSETTNLPLLGPIIVGQVEFLEVLLFTLLYDRFGPTDSIYFISFLLFCVIWGIAGALFLSRKKRQVRSGVILLILYSIMGMVWYVFKLINVISN